MPVEIQMATGELAWAQTSVDFGLPVASFTVQLMCYSTGTAPVFMARLLAATARRSAIACDLLTFMNCAHHIVLQWS